MEKTCTMRDPPAYTTIESTAQNLQPFFPKLEFAGEKNMVHF